MLSTIRQTSADKNWTYSGAMSSASLILPIQFDIFLSSSWDYWWSQIHFLWPDVIVQRDCRTSWCTAADIFLVENMYSKFSSISIGLLLRKVFCTSTATMSNTLDLYDLWLDSLNIYCAITCLASIIFNKIRWAILCWLFNDQPHITCRTHQKDTQVAWARIGSFCNIEGGMKWYRRSRKNLKI